MKHPFQTDPGTSQRQRVADALLAEAPAIDARRLADLLDYFVQLSRHVNFYDNKLQVSDWQPFFQKSLPFILSSIIRYNDTAVTEKFNLYNKLFDKNPSSQSLQLLLHFTYYNAIHRIHTWYTQLQQSDLPVGPLAGKLIADKLARPVKQFIRCANSGAAWFGLKKMDFSLLQQQPVWNLTAQDLVQLEEDIPLSGTTQRKRLIALRNKLLDLFPSFVQVIKSLSDTAGLYIEQSLFPLKEELKQQHTPHLGLLFAFLKLFQHLQADLNHFTRRHLDFFYREVLKIQPREAVPDKAHIVFEIQNQLDQYLLKKGLQVKDGKDRNKAEVFFALDEEMVVNKAQVSDVRTLFLYHQKVYNRNFIQGVYMAPDARKADGVEQEFTGTGPHSFPTVGAHLSKYTNPELKTIQPYPAARIGFLLASPVLLLSEGQRTIEINLACRIKDVCTALAAAGLQADASQDCCNETNLRVARRTPDPCSKQPVQPLPHALLFDRVNKALKKTFFYITEATLQAAIKKGLAPDTAEKIRRRFLTDQCDRPVCCSHAKKYLQEAIVLSKHWHRFTRRSITENEKNFLAAFFKPQRAFRLFFSGEKAWLEPDRIKYLEMEPDPGDLERFMLKIKLVVDAAQPAITFYNKDNLQEDFKTEQPVFKAELNEAVKLVVNKQFRKQFRNKRRETCALDKTQSYCATYLSLYQFFRNVVLSETDKLKTTIRVKVCGLKNFVVQNDESLMDVNAPVYPFGTRPEIKDFDIKNLPDYPPATPPFTTDQNLIGPNFYIGSQEVFGKKWDQVYINFHWKDKPTDFGAYYAGYLRDDTGHFGLKESNFLINLSVLENSEWKKEKPHAVPHTEHVIIKGVSYHNRLLFQNNHKAPFCNHAGDQAQTLYISKDFFDLQQEFRISKDKLTRYNTDTPHGFLRINLQLQDFCHKVYAYVLARQMMALGKLPDDKIEDAIYYDSTTGNLIVFRTDLIKDQLNNAATVADRINTGVNGPGGLVEKVGLPGSGAISGTDAQDMRRIIYPDTISLEPVTIPGGRNLKGDAAVISGSIAGINSIINDTKNFQAIIPNEPWTPIIQGMSLDYTATATIQDITFIHLYPFTGTYKQEAITLEPALLPSFCDEGTLYIGLQQLTPGSNVNILFQLAEATADAESEREMIQWYYLHNNSWQPLRNGFNILHDATNGLTTSGIVRFAIPEKISTDNTILPAGLHWIKACIPQNSRSVSETIGIHTQAVRVTFTNEEANDKLRLSQPLPAKSIAKLKEADTAVKKVLQPYESFDGRIPEIEGQYYVRVSELLRHKDRAIQKFDYERIVLEAFPQLLKVKCINHSYALNAHQYKNDFPIAPGYVLLAVLPDLSKLKAAESFEPRVPVSLLEKVHEYVLQRTSPFVRLRVMNARYEKVHICLKVKLYPGKDVRYYKEQLQQDLRGLLAPWTTGEYEQLTFGQCINRSDIIRFLETRDYLDYVLELKMQHEEDGTPLSTLTQVCGKTPRSILIAGQVDVCIAENDCESWDKRNRCQHPPQTIMDYCKNDRPVIN